MRVNSTDAHLRYEAPMRCFRSAANPSSRGPYWTAAAPRGVGGLLGMAALDPREAGRAASHRDAEAGDDRLGLGQVDLVPVVDGDWGLVQRRAALRALRRQRDLDGAIDLFQRRGGSMAGWVHSLAPRSLGVSANLSRSASARNSSICRA
jgi:hypothetical protein